MLEMILALIGTIAAHILEGVLVELLATFGIALV